MKPSNDLFHLIKSLSRNEKRYFSIHASRHVVGDSNNYMTLFRAIDEQEEFDDEELKRKLKGTPIADHLAESKLYLYRLLMKSLRAFHAENVQEIAIREMLNDATILFQRGLPEQAMKMVEKAVKAADAAGYSALVVEAVSWMVDAYHLGIPNLEAMEGYLNIGREKLADIREAFDTSGSYIDIWHKLSAAKQHEMYALGHEEPLSRNILRQTAQNMPKSIRGQAYYYSSRIFQCYLQKEFSEALDLSRKLLDVVRSNVSTKPTIWGYRLYVASVSNYFFACIGLKQHCEADRALEEFAQLADDPLGAQTLGSRWEVFVLYHRLTFAARIGEFDKVYVYALEIEKKHFYRLNDTTQLYVKSLRAYAAYGLGNIEQALEVMNTEVKSEARGKMMTRPSILFFQAVLHLELGNREVVLSLFRSIERYLRSRGGLGETQQMVLSHLRKAARCSSVEEEHLWYASLLEDLQEQPEEGLWVSNDLFEIRYWLQARLRGIPYAAIVHEAVQEESSVAV